MGLRLRWGTRFCGGLGGGEFVGDGFGGGHRADGVGEGGSQDAAFGDDCGDVFGGRDVEGRVFDGYAVRSDLDAVDVGDFAGRALLDGDEVAGCGGEIDGVEGRGDVERDAVL